MFRRLLKLRSKALMLLKIYVGSGDTAFFWWDPWTPLGSLYSFLGESCPSQLGVPLFTLVSDVSKNGSSWSLPPTIRSEKQVQLLAFISSLPSSTSADSRTGPLMVSLRNVLFQKLFGVSFPQVFLTKFGLRWFGTRVLSQDIQLQLGYLF